MNYAGEIQIQLDEDSVVKTIETLKRENVESIAVSFLWSIMNPQHEQRVEILAEKLPDVPVVLSSDVLPMIREWDPNNLYNTKCLSCQVSQNIWLNCKIF